MSLSQTQMAAGSQESGITGNTQMKIKVIKGLGQGWICSLEFFQIKAGPRLVQRRNSTYQEKNISVEKRSETNDSVTRILDPWLNLIFLFPTKQEFCILSSTCKSHTLEIWILAIGSVLRTCEKCWFEEVVWQR